MSNENIKEQQFFEKVPELLINAFLKAICFDAVLNAGLGGVEGSKGLPFKIVVATTVYFVRDVVRELLPENYKLAAIGVGLGAGGMKGFVNGDKILATALNNAAYETSTYFLDKTLVDDWISAPVIETIETLATTTEAITYDSFIKIAFSMTAAVTLSTNLYIAAENTVGFDEQLMKKVNTCGLLDEEYQVDLSNQCLDTDYL